MSIINTLLRRTQIKTFDDKKMPSEIMINSLIQKTYELTPSKQSLVPYKVHVLGPKDIKYKKIFYELSKSQTGGGNNTNIFAPYVLLFTFRLCDNPNESVKKKIEKGDWYPSCNPKKYRKQKSQTGIEIGMFAKILTMLCLDKKIDVSYLLCYPDWDNDKEKNPWTKLDFITDPVLFSMQIGYCKLKDKEKPLDEYKPDKDEIINWV